MTSKQKLRLEEILENLNNIRALMSSLPNSIVSHFRLDYDDMRNMVEILLEENDDE